MNKFAKSLTLTMLVLFFTVYAAEKSWGGGSAEQGTSTGTQTGAAGAHTPAVGSGNREKYALVIGNGAYTSITKLNNPVNDAQDIGAALKSLGFQVDLKLNARHLQMIDAVDAFVTRLAASPSSEGFFWYAGHAVQIRDENYLLPVDVMIDSESRVRATSHSLAGILEALEGAHNKVNVLILDACRNNPLPVSGRGAGNSRGLSVIRDVPPDLFVMFSTQPGNTADDGAAGKRNSPFAEAFLKHINSPEPLILMATDVTNETMRLTEGRQQPFNRGSIISEKYYSLNPDGPPAAVVTPEPAAVQPAPAPKPAPQPAPVVQPAAPPPERPAPNNMVRVEGGTFLMGSNSHIDAEKPVHSVTVKSFYMGKYEVTQKEWREVMGTTVRQQNDMSDLKGIDGEGDNHPMYHVNWLEAVEYCNKLSQKEGLTPCYRGSGGDITYDWNANGYRLPTEAEWEFAAKGGVKDLMTTEYSGSNSVDAVAWYEGNSGKTTHPVGQKRANSLGIYDMSGNVQEWCWDWYGNYSSNAQTDPRGASSGSERILRGGSYRNSDVFVRSVYRTRTLLSYRSPTVGFRLVRS